MGFYVTVNDVSCMGVGERVAYLGSYVHGPIRGHRTSVPDLPVQAVGEVLHDYACVIPIDFEVIDRGYVRVVETSCQPCLVHDGIDVSPFHRGELVEHLDRYGTFEERVFTEVDGSLSACPNPLLQFVAINTL